MLPATRCCQCANWFHLFFACILFTKLYFIYSEIVMCRWRSIQSGHRYLAWAPKHLVHGPNPCQSSRFESNSVWKYVLFCWQFVYCDQWDHLWVWHCSEYFVCLCLSILMHCIDFVKTGSLIFALFCEGIMNICAKISNPMALTDIAFSERAYGTFLSLWSYCWCLCRYDLCLMSSTLSLL